MGAGSPVESERGRAGVSGGSSTPRTSRTVRPARAVGGAGSGFAEADRVHELALMESLIETVAEELAGERVTCVRLEIGALAGVDCEALRFCFGVCARGTPLEGAGLEIVAIPGRARCRRCGGEGPLTRLGAPCACGAFDRELLAGQELRLKDVEVL
jgi:hydrogenase nickel incorporation protein HypA/HybF